MTREEMISKLSAINLVAAATVYTEDMGLQYEYITSEGAGISFGNMGRWPVYRYKGIESEKCTKIQTRIREGLLDESDLEGTQFFILVKMLHNVYGSLFEEYYGNLSKVFEDFLSIPAEQNETFYSLVDISDWGAFPKFYCCEEQLIEAFKDEYCICITPWNKMSDDNLEYWLDAHDDYLQELYYHELDESYLED